MIHITPIYRFMNSVVTKEEYTCFLFNVCETRDNFFYVGTNNSLNFQVFNDASDLRHGNYTLLNDSACYRGKLRVDIIN